jgi:hypothetical protein
MADLKNTIINDTEFLKLPGGTEAQRPSVASWETGMMRYNTSENPALIEFYNGSTWVQLGAAIPIDASGGSISDITVGGQEYRVHSFTSTGNSTFTVNSLGTSPLVDVLVVAGGGGGGNDNAGGGGAGGCIFSEGVTVSAQSYTITVGAGGGAQSGEYPGLDGGGSSALGISCTGGGGGGGGSQGQNGRNGGSGGGCGGEGQPNTVGSGISGQGFPGGREGAVGDGNGGGGGGKGGPGGAAGTGNVSQSGNGGVGGDFSSYFGTSYGESGYFAGGGAGAVGNGPTGTTPPSNFGNGGLGGGGDHGKNNAPTYFGESGIDGTGGGGAGSAYTGSQYGTPGDGGNGIVLIRYPI